MLERKALRSCTAHDTDMDEVRSWIDEVLGSLREQGLLNDRRYAEAAIRSLRRRGSSTRQISAKLYEKGVVSEVVESLLSEESELGETELRSACAFARRRRFGPFRRVGDPCPDRRRKELASFARAGFSREHAETVLGAESVEALESFNPVSPGGWD